MDNEGSSDITSLQACPLIPDLIRDLLRKKPKHRDTEIIRIILCHSVPLC